MAKFRKKPVVIEAVQFRPIAKCWPPSVFETGRKFYCKTANGDVEIQPGDWICSQRINRKLDWWPCKPHIFEATYDPAD
jgi:hypothetical protein